MESASQQELNNQLLAVAKSGDLKHAHYLLEKGAQPNLYNEHGLTPLHLAVDNNNITVAQALLLADADPNIVNPNTGWTSLHYAVYLNRLEMVFLILVNNHIEADLTILTDDGTSVFDLALTNMKTAISASGAMRALAIANLLHQYQKIKEFKER